jgi:hypothetical protein
MEPLAPTWTAPLTAVSEGKPTRDTLNIGAAWPEVPAAELPAAELPAAELPAAELPTTVSGVSSALPAVLPVPVPEAPLADAAIIATLPDVPCFAAMGGQALAAEVMAADRVVAGVAEADGTPAAAGRVSDAMP